MSMRDGTATKSGCGNVEHTGIGAIEMYVRWICMKNLSAES